MRLYPARAACTSTRIFAVCTAGNATSRQTLLFPATCPPGTVTHAAPSQYCTSNAVAPYCENVIPAAGSAGAQYASCTVNTPTRSIVRVPPKSTCSQSGWASAVASFHPPPAPQFEPFRSPSIAPAGAYPALCVEDAVAVAPLDASAWFTPPTGVGVG